MTFGYYLLAGGLVETSETTESGRAGSFVNLWHFEDICRGPEKGSQL